MVTRNSDGGLDSDVGLGRLTQNPAAVHDRAPTCAGRFRRRRAGREGAVRQVNVALKVLAERHRPPPPPGGQTA